MSSLWGYKSQANIEGQSLLSWFAGKHFTLDPYLALVPNQVIKSRI